MAIKNITIRNNTVSSYSIELADYDNVRENRWFVAAKPQDEISIPLNYAFSIYTLPHAMSALEQGLIEIVKNKKEFEQLCIEDGLITSEIKDIVSNKEIEEVLKSGAEDKVAELLSNPKTSTRAINIALDKTDELQKSTVSLVEKTSNIALEKTL